MRGTVLTCGEVDGERLVATGDIFKRDVQIGRWAMAMAPGNVEAGQASRKR